MAFNVSDLTAYVKSNPSELMVSAILKGETVDFVNKQSGIKKNEYLYYFDTDAVFQAWSCGFSTNGTTTLTEKTVSVVPIKVNEQICTEDLNGFAQEQLLNPGMNKNLPGTIEALYIQRKMEQIAKNIEMNIWANAAASTTAPSGLIYKFLNDAVIMNTGVYSASTVFNHYHQNLTGSTTASEWMAIVYELQNGLPAEVQQLSDLTLFVGYPIFRKIVQALIVANLYHINLTGNDGSQAFMFPGTNILLKPVPGLNTLNNMVLTPRSNIVYLTDLQNEFEKVDFFWSNDDQINKYIFLGKYGIDYRFSEYVVLSLL